VATVDLLSALRDPNTFVRTKVLRHRLTGYGNLAVTTAGRLSAARARWPPLALADPGRFSVWTAGVDADCEALSLVS